MSHAEHVEQKLRFSHNFESIWSFKKENGSLHNVAGETWNSFSLRAIVKVNNYPRQTYKVLLTLM